MVVRGSAVTTRMEVMMPEGGDDAHNPEIMVQRLHEMTEFSFVAPPKPEIHEQSSLYTRSDFPADSIGYASRLSLWHYDPRTWKGAPDDFYN